MRSHWRLLPSREKTFCGAAVLSLKPARLLIMTARFDVATIVVPFLAAPTVGDVRTVVRTVVLWTVLAIVIATFGPKRSRAEPSLCEMTAGAAPEALEAKRPGTAPSLADVASVSDRRSITPPPSESPPLPRTEVRADNDGGSTCLRATALAGVEGAFSRMTRLGLAAAARTAWYGDCNCCCWCLPVVSTVLAGSTSSSPLPVLGPRR